LVSYNGLGSFAKLAISSETVVKILGHMYPLFVLGCVPSMVFSTCLGLCTFSIRAILGRVMYFERGYEYMDLKMERHPHAGGEPARGDSLDSRGRGNDHLAASPFCQHSKCITHISQLKTLYPSIHQ
jgi:hypothetical protein